MVIVMNRQHSFIKFIIFLISIVISGCGIARILSVPSGTTADFGLRKDIAQMIDIHQKAHQPNCSYRIVETRLIGAEDETLLEEWTVEACDELIVYEIKLNAYSTGGTLYSVSRKKPEGREFR